MLSELQQKDVWEGWLGSEMRAIYFADLAGRYAFRQNLLLWLTLLFTSGAAVSLVTAWVPSNYAWLKPAMAFIAAGLSLLNVVFQNQRRSFECRDLHYRWNRIASQYQNLWNDMYSADAAETLEDLKANSAEASRSGLGIPYSERLMSKWEDHVIQHRVRQLPRVPAST